MELEMKFMLHIIYNENCNLGYAVIPLALNERTAQLPCCIAINQRDLF
jgi:hypothetical protein